VKRAKTISQIWLELETKAHSGARRTFTTHSRREKRGELAGRHSKRDHSRVNPAIMDKMSGVGNAFLQKENNSPSSLSE